MISTLKIAWKQKSSYILLDYCSRMRTIYLDHAATTPMSAKAIHAMQRYFTQDFGNPHSSHTIGESAREAVEKSRSHIAQIIGCKPDEIVFTSGGTESNNLAIQGIMRQYPHGELIVSAIEHPSVLECAYQLQKQGWTVHFISVNSDGVVNLRELEKMITKKTRLISVMHVNNVVGTIQPLKQILQLSRKRGVLFHTDAVQAAGKLDLIVPDLLSISGHKFGGPKGIGALVVREGIQLSPLLFGGGQEYDVRSGTLNVPGIVGMCAAISSRAEIRSDPIGMKKLRDWFCGQLRELGGRIAGSVSSPFIVCAAFDGVDAELLAEHLDQKGVCISRGSACHEGQEEPSHVLVAMGVESPEEYVRFSFSRSTTRKELESALTQLAPIVQSLRKLS